MTVAEESKILAQRMIDVIKSAKGIDFQPHFDTIAGDIENYVFDGNWNHTIDVEDSNFPDIRVIQEDEYDQYMDEDDEDTPSWDDLLQVDSYYLLVE